MEILIAKYHLHPIIDHFTIALLGMGVLADVAGYVIAKLFSNRSPRTKGLGATERSWSSRSSRP